MLEISPIQLSTSPRPLGGRRAQRLLLAGCVLGLLAMAPASQAAVVFGTETEIEWAAAPGQVSHYGVWVIVGSDRATVAPTFTTKSTRTTLAAKLGDALVTKVAAFYTDGTQGPFSPPSELMHFVHKEIAPYDLDGDGAVDSVLRGARDDTRKAVLLGTGGAEKEAALPVASDDKWRVSGSADFDADADADLLMWNMDTGAAELWLMEGAARKSVLPVGTLGKEWYPRALGDRERSGAARVLWTNRSTGQTVLWLMQRNRVVEQFALLPMDPSWEVWGNCDVDGNGFRDVVWIDEKATQARLWLMGGEDAIDEVDIDHPGAAFEMQACGDFDRDDRETLVWQDRNRTARLLLWDMTSVQGSVATGSQRMLKIPGRHRVGQAGDLDGDGDADLVLINSYLGSVKILTMNGDAVEREHAMPVDPKSLFEVSSW